jgi:hypothetical protein
VLVPKILSSCAIWEYSLVTNFHSRRAACYGPRWTDDDVYREFLTAEDGGCHFLPRESRNRGSWAGSAAGAIPAILYSVALDQVDLGTPAALGRPQPLLQELAGDDHALDLVGALVDLGDRGPAGSFRR